MYIMNNIIKYVIISTWTLAVIRVTALPTSSKVIESAVNYEVISDENTHTESNEDSNNEEAEVNRSKKSATTFCVEIKSGTPECVPCQPVIMAAQPQVVYVTNDNTSDPDIINETASQRQNEIVLPPEPPCPKEELFLIVPPPQVQSTVSLVQVPIVHQVPQSPQMFVATKPFLETHFPELLNDSNVQIQPLVPGDESLSVIDPPSAQLFQPLNPFAMSESDYWNVNLDPKDNSYSPKAFGVEGPPLSPEHRNTGQSFPNALGPQYHPSPIGIFDNHGVNANLDFGVEAQDQSTFLQPPQYPHVGPSFKHGTVPQYQPSIGVGQHYGFEGQHQPSFMATQQGSLNRRVPPQQYPPLFMNSHASGQKFAHGDAGQLPIRESAKPQTPANVHDIQTHQGYFPNMNLVMGQDGMGYYLVPAVINGNPQLCLQPEPMTNPSLDSVHQQSSTQHSNSSAPDAQPSPSVNKQSREVKDAKGTLKSPKVQTTVAPIKSGPKSQQDTRGKGGSSSLLNNLKGSPSLSKAKAPGKGQNKDGKTNEKPELKRGNKRETEIFFDK